MMQNDATDPFLQETVENLPSPGDASGRFHLAQTFINPLNSMPFGDGPSLPRRPDGED